MAESSTGTLVPEVDMSNWRVAKQENRLKFDDKLKTKYLMFLAEHGKKTLAARQCGISYPTYLDHVNNDPEFAQWVEIALEERAHRIVKRLEHEAMEGFEEGIFNKEGEQVGTRLKHETQLRAMILKRYDPEYKDRSEINHTGGAGTGVLVVPAALTLEDAAAQGEELRQKMIERQKEENVPD